jgi:hypothetical protein
MVDVDWSWREFCTGNDIGQIYFWDHGFTLEGLPSLLTECGHSPGELDLLASPNLEWPGAAQDS